MLEGTKNSSANPYLFLPKSTDWLFSADKVVVGDFNIVSASAFITLFTYSLFHTVDFPEHVNYPIHCFNHTLDLILMSGIKTFNIQQFIYPKPEFLNV